MTPRFGRCWNQDLCTLAQNRTVVRIAPGALFVCPHCARPLREAPAPKLAGGGAGRAAAALLALTLIAAGGVAWWYENRPRPPRVAAVRATAAVVPRAVAARTPLPAAPASVAPAVGTAPAIVAAAAAPSVLMRLVGEAPLAAGMLPALLKAFLESSGDADVAVSQVQGAVLVVGHSEAGAEAMRIAIAPAGDAFATLADGGAELVFAARGPDAAERRALPRVRSVSLGGAPGALVLTAPVPSDPAAASLLAYAASVAGRAALAQAGFAPVHEAAPTPKPQTPVPVKPAQAEAPAPPEAPPPKTDSAAPPPASVAPAAVPQAPPAAAGDTAAPTGPREVHLPASAKAAFDTALSTAPVATPAPSAGPREVHLPAGSQVIFGPLKDVQMPVDQQRMIFLAPKSSSRAPGSLQVDCLIQTSGVPKDCRLLAAHGAEDVSGSILGWLASGAIRYSPALKDGRKVEERRTLTVNFRHPAAEQ